MQNPDPPLNEEYDVSELPDLTPGYDEEAEAERARDRYVPDTYEGKLEPNYYCRAWRSGKESYCRARAGSGTVHSGEGRCQMHDGAGRALMKQLESEGIVRADQPAPLTTRYNRLSPSLQRLQDEHLSASVDQYEIHDELALARAFLERYIAEYDEVKQALLDWHVAYTVQNGAQPPKQALLNPTHVYQWISRITKIAQDERKLKSDMYVTRAELLKIMTALGRIVTAILDDETLSRDEMKARVRQEWNAVKIK